MWEWGEFAISNEMFREGFIEKVRIEEISERGKVRGKDFHSVGRSSALNKYIFCAYVIYGSLDLPLYSYELVGHKFIIQNFKGQK